MTPTPPSHGTFHSRFRRSRPTNTHIPAAQHLQAPVTPLPDEGVEYGGAYHGEELEEEEDGSQEEGEEELDGEIEGEEDEEEQDEEDEEDEEGGIEEVPMEMEVPFNAETMGLKEIGNLASWTVSSCKPGCGVDALRDDDTSLFWQSDGPQPHHLNIHFSRLVSIRSIRIYLDFEADESYTPTRITLLAGTGYHDLIAFAGLDFTQPKGWIDVPLDHVGGGEDGKTLRAFLVQVKVVENHQNGKDTHVRGLKIYAKDERVKGGISEKEALTTLQEIGSKKAAKKKADEKAPAGGDSGWLVEEDWMGEPELR